MAGHRGSRIHAADSRNWRILPKFAAAKGLPADFRGARFHWASTLAQSSRAVLLTQRACGINGAIRYVALSYTPRPHFAVNVNGARRSSSSMDGTGGICAAGADTLTGWRSATERYGARRTGESMSSDVYLTCANCSPPSVETARPAFCALGGTCAHPA